MYIFEYLWTVCEAFYHEYDMHHFNLKQIFG